jgi:hypothetical protein
MPKAIKYVTYLSLLISAIAWAVALSVRTPTDAMPYAGFAFITGVMPMLWWKEASKMDRLLVAGSIVAALSVWVLLYFVFLSVTPAR